MIFSLFLWVTPNEDISKIHYIETNFKKMAIILYLEFEKLKTGVGLLL